MLLCLGNSTWSRVLSGTQAPSHAPNLQQQWHNAALETSDVVLAPISYGERRVTLSSPNTTQQHPNVTPQQETPLTPVSYSDFNFIKTFIQPGVEQI